MTSIFVLFFVAAINSILQDVFIVDTTKEVFVWVGKKASVDERRNGMTYAHVSIH